MLRLSRRVARPLLVLGLVAWVMGVVAAQVHVLVVQHVVCAEHGEVVEIRDGERAVANADVSHDVAVPAPVDQHDHGCSFDGIAPWAAFAPVLAHADAPTVQDLPTHTVQVAIAGPRGPPLAYAPKTSPPQAC